MAQERAGLILAGGRGERFGGPKAFALLPDGRTFLAACLHALAAAQARPVVATVPAGGECRALPGLLAVPLPTPDLDMFGSLREGAIRLLAEPAWQVVVVLPVDHPLVRAETVARVGDAVRGAAVAARPVFAGKHGHPVALARSVAQALARGALAGPTLRDVLRQVGTLDVPVDDPGVTANCNTPERLAAALAGVG